MYTWLKSTVAALSVIILPTLARFIPAGVEPPAGALNPATWMLDITAVGSEAQLDVDFADVYQDSQLSR